MKLGVKVADLSSDSRQRANTPAANRQPGFTNAQHAADNSLSPPPVLSAPPPLRFFRF